jgi:hypothetical protein
MNTDPSTEIGVGDRSSQSGDLDEYLPRETRAFGLIDSRHS